jgi:hypothetical protein
MRGSAVLMVLRLRYRCCVHLCMLLHMSRPLVMYVSLASAPSYIKGGQPNAVPWYHISGLLSQALADDFT